MHAGIVRARGDVVVTMDADLQNSPADILRLVDAVDAGSDVASGRRASRDDGCGRMLPSKLVNRMLRELHEVRHLRLRLRVQRATAATRCSRWPARSASRSSRRRSSSRPARASSRWTSTTRQRDGRSRYTWLGLIRVALHVIAGFWPQPIQWAGMIDRRHRRSLLAHGGRDLGDRRSGSRESDFPGQLFLAALVLAILGIQGFIFALVGEYLGRLQRDVEGRPLYTVASDLDGRHAPDA